MIQRLHREGQSWFNADALIEACKHDGLWVGALDVPGAIRRLGIRSFSRFAGGMEDETDELICLTRFFTGRNIRDDQLWSAEIVPQLSKFLSQKLKTGGRYRIHLATLGSVAFVTGYLAEPKLGAEVELVQSGIGGTKLWASDTRDSDTDVGIAAQPIVSTGMGNELVVAVSITHTIDKDVKTFVDSAIPAAGKLLHVGMPEVSQDSIKDGNHAFRAATEVVKLIDDHRRELGAKHTHLFWAAPNAFAFMLGQLSRPLGAITLYEFDFEGTAGGGYQPSLSLSPEFRLD